jgi:hypothetical protein
MRENKRGQAHSVAKYVGSPSLLPGAAVHEDQAFFQVYSAGTATSWATGADIGAATNSG